MKHSIPVPTYDSFVDLYIYKSEKKLLKKYNALCDKLGYDKEEAFKMDGVTFASYCDKNMMSRVSIILKKDVIDINLIAHEALHAVSRILIPRGLYFNFETSEAYTYLLGYICDEIHKFCKVKNIKKSKR